MTLLCLQDAFVLSRIELPVDHRAGFDYVVALGQRGGHRHGELLGEVVAVHRAAHLFAVAR